MKKSKLSNDEGPQRPLSDWISFITDYSDKKNRVPIGPRFQADVPPWTDIPNKEQFRNSYIKDSNMVCFNNKVWTGKNPEKAGERIGAGRPDHCICNNPGSVDCVRMHISEKRTNLRTEVGLMFFAWGFDKMGEIVSSSWSKEEEVKFGSLVRLNPVSQGKSFLKPAIKSIVTKNREDIINYYFNVYLLRRMTTQIRSGSYILDTDDEGGEEDASPSGKRSRNKRARDSEVVKTKYLMGSR